MAPSAVDPSTLLQIALDLSPTATLMADVSGKIVLIGGELERQFGYTRRELVGQPIDLLIPEGLWSPGFPETPAQESGREVIARRKDESRVRVVVGLQPIETRDEAFVVVTLIDQEARHRQEDEQAVALSEQLQFQRLIADLSVQFINVSDDRVHEAIREGLRRIHQQLGVDRSTLYKLSADAAVIDPITWPVAEDAAATPTAPRGELFPWTFERILAGQVVAFSRVDEIASPTDRASFRAQGTKSAVVVPLSVADRVVGAVEFQMTDVERTWPAVIVHRLTVIGSVFDQVLARWQRSEALRAASLELQWLRDELQVENQYLHREERERFGSTQVVGQSPAIQRVLQQIHQVAATDATVLLRGETGTGKELLAAQLHELGARHARPMVRVNCAAIPATLIESELFGRERGAYTGALARQIGRFELANHSTIFLDEIGDLPADVQVKLLRVLEERTIERLGNPRPIVVDTRIIAATHRNLEQLTAEGTFREDLYYRLNVFPIHVPPLRERVEDIPLLFWRFVEEFSKAFGKRIDSIDSARMAALQEYRWPGNIRELRNVVERAMIVAVGRELTITLPVTPTAQLPGPRLLDVEKEHIRAVLQSTSWRIRGRGGAAEQLGLKPTTLETRIAKLGLKRADHR